MPDITSLEVVRVSNESVRPMAETMLRLVAELGLLAPDIARLLPSIPNDPDSILIDGSEFDGRTPLSGADLHELAGLANTVAALYTPSAAVLLAKAKVRTIQIR